MCWVEELQECPVTEQGVGGRVHVVGTLKAVVVVDVWGSGEVSGEGDGSGQDVCVLTPIASGMQLRQDVGNLEWDLEHVAELYHQRSEVP